MNIQITVGLLRITRIGLARFLAILICEWLYIVHSLLVLCIFSAVMVLLFSRFGYNEINIHTYIQHGLQGGVQYFPIIFSLQKQQQRGCNIKLTTRVRCRVCHTDPWPDPWPMTRQNIVEPVTRRLTRFHLWGRGNIKRCRVNHLLCSAWWWNETRVSK